MSQFDVHRNTGKHQAAIPFVVIVQSAAFDRLARRLVIPLLDAAGAGDRIKIPYSGTTPRVVLNGQALVLNTFDMVSVETARLGQKVGSLADSADLIVAALNEVFSRAYG